MCETYMCKLRNSDDMKAIFPPLGVRNGTFWVPALWKPLFAPPSLRSNSSSDFCVNNDLASLIV